MHVHSPVAIDVYDHSGNHTGLSTSTIPDSDIAMIDEQIPNSYYLEFGEGKYVGLDTDDAYAVLLHGTDTGTFSFIAEKVIGGIATTVATYTDIPITPSTTATLLIDENGGAQNLTIDSDSDGDTDATIDEAGDIDPLAYIALFRATVQQMDLKPVVKKLILAGLRLVEKDLQKNKIKQARIKLEILGKGIKLGIKKDQLPMSDGEILLRMVERLKDLIL